MTGADILLCYWYSASTWERIIMLEMLYAEACKDEFGGYLSRRLFIETCPLRHYFT